MPTSKKEKIQIVKYNNLYKLNKFEAIKKNIKLRGEMRVRKGEN